MTINLDTITQATQERGSGKAALWIGILTTLAICSFGWVAALGWVVAHGGIAELIGHTDAIFAVAAVSLFCACVASASAYVALVWRAQGPLLATPKVRADDRVLAGDMERQASAVS
jgi:hypothetical protein